MRKKESGQATIIILTMMVAAVGVGLLITRGVQTDIQMTKVQEESARAFSAAEAGVESALYNWSPATESHDYPLETGDVSVLSTNLGESETEFNLPGKVFEGDFGTIWLSAHDSSGAIDEGSYYQNPASGADQVRVCWNNGAALELILFYKDGVDYKTKRWAYDPNPATRADNHFDSPNTDGCAGLDLRADLDWPNNSIPLFIIAKTFYGETTLGAEAVGDGVVFFSQGKLVTSTGEVQALEDKVVSRRLQVFQTWDIPPLIFFEPVFFRLRFAS